MVFPFVAANRQRPQKRSSGGDQLPSVLGLVLVAAVCKTSSGRCGERYKTERPCRCRLCGFLTGSFHTLLVETNLKLGTIRRGTKKREPREAHHQLHAFRRVCGAVLSQCSRLFWARVDRGYCFNFRLARASSPRHFKPARQLTHLDCALFPPKETLMHSHGQFLSGEANFSV